MLIGSSSSKRIRRSRSCSYIPHITRYRTGCDKWHGDRISRTAYISQAAPINLRWSTPSLHLAWNVLRNLALWHSPRQGWWIISIPKAGQGSLATLARCARCISDGWLRNLDPLRVKHASRNKGLGPSHKSVDLAPTYLVPNIDYIFILKFTAERSEWRAEAIQ